MIKCYVCQGPAHQGRYTQRERTTTMCGHVLFHIPNRKCIETWPWKKPHNAVICIRFTILGPQ